MIDALRGGRHPTGWSINYSKLANWAQVRGEAGKEQTVAEFEIGAALAEKEQGTLTWYAVKLGERIWNFRHVADEKGRKRT